MTIAEKALAEGIKYGKAHKGEGSGEDWKAFEEGFIAGAEWKGEMNEDDFRIRVQGLLNKQDNERIDKACEWLGQQLYTDSERGCIESEYHQSAEGLIEAFRKAMEE